MRARSLRRTLALLVLAISCAPPLAPGAGAQTPPDMNALVADWATGRYASPVMCEIGGQLVRGVRRVILRPRHDLGRPVTLAIHFVDMRPDGAARCINSLGVAQPNVLGKLVLQIPGKSHPETAARDFKRTLKSERRFSFDVVEGVLKLQPVAEPPAEPRIVEFRGGEAAIGLVLPATDPARELAPFDSPRKLLVVVEAPDGERLELPLFLASDDPV